MERIRLEKTPLGQEQFDMRYNGQVFKWPKHAILREFQYQDDHVRPNLAKVRQFQQHTDSLEECVEWAINSIKNDQEQKRRCLDHGTGAL
jgi:hypothetical protein